MKVIIASNNAHKIEEFAAAFKPYGVSVCSLKDANIYVDPEETGKTFKENAYIKAAEVAKLTKYVVIADDSGIEVEALDGFPGIYSARFMEDQPYVEKFKAFNKMLEDKNNRRANYNCALCVMNLEKEPLYFEGKVYGVLLEEPRGTAGFGYDPIFFYPPFNKTFAEISQDVKNGVSHRGIAIKLLMSYLKEHHL